MADGKDDDQYSLYSFSSIRAEPKVILISFFELHDDRFSDKSLERDQ